MARPNDGIPPDGFELRIRFGCGALLGAVFGAGTLARLDAKSPGWLVVASALGALAVGLLARHFGDRFWWSLRHWLWL